MEERRDFSSEGQTHLVEIWGLLFVIHFMCVSVCLSVCALVCVCVCVSKIFNYIVAMKIILWFISSTINSVF